MKWFVLTAAVFLALALGAIVSDWALASQRPDSRGDVKLLVHANNQFAFDLYHQLRKKDGNLLFSPHSVSNALAMAYAGARGETASQMAQVLGWKSVDRHLHRGFSDLQLELHIDDAKGLTQLFMANALWGQKDLRFNRDFLRLAKEHHQAALHEVDYVRDPEAARHRINRWVATQTRNKICEILGREDVDHSTRLVISNAVYFRSQWFAPFAKQFTKEIPFHVNVKEMPTVPMMFQSFLTNYYSDDFAELVELPYCNRLSLVVVLPRKAKELHKLEQLIAEPWLRERVDRLKKHWVHVTLPKARISMERRLAGELSNLGMSERVRKASWAGQILAFGEDVVHAVRKLWTFRPGETHGSTKPTADLPQRHDGCGMAMDQGCDSAGNGRWSPPGHRYASGSERYPVSVA